MYEKLRQCLCIKGMVEMGTGNVLLLNGSESTALAEELLSVSASRGTGLLLQSAERRPEPTVPAPPQPQQAGATSCGEPTRRL